MAFQRPSLDGVDRRLKDDPDVSQVDLRLAMNCVEIRSRLDTSFSHILLERSSGIYGGNSYGAWRPA